MSSKSESKEEKVFNGGSLVDWNIIRDVIELEADRQNCKHHLVYHLEDIVDGVVAEAVFVGLRLCVKGQEQIFVDQAIGQQIIDVQIAAAAKTQRIEATNYGNTAAGLLQKTKDLNSAADKESDDIARLEQSKFKLLLDTQAAGARYDTEFRQFDVDRAKAISILRKFLGPNPKNNIARELTELRPRAAWKKLSDIYASDAATASHLNNTTKLMSGMIFEKKFGDVSEHMGLLDKLNETLVAAGRGKSDAELLNYLTSAMEKSKDGAMYKTTLDVLSALNKSDRVEVLEALRNVEQRAKSAEALRGNHTIAGARFGMADVVFAGTASTSQKSGYSARRSAKFTSGDKSVILCVKCCQTGHRARDCDVHVVCNFCKKTNHCEQFCWMKDPSQKPARFKANTAQLDLEESDSEKDITKVTKK
jgi:hypothetical protein